MIFPPALRKGAKVHVVAPSGPFDRCLVLRGLGWLSTRYRVTFRPDMFDRFGFLAGSDERRSAELNAALQDPAIDAVVVARGGHGLLRVIPSIAFGALTEHPKWLVGFSDPTALHLEATRVGIVSLHAENVSGLGRSDAETRLAWLSALEQPQIPRSYRGDGWTKGRVNGPLVGGNLTLLTMAAAAGRLTLPHGCILALEDVAESSYRIDRMLSVLKIGGHLDRVAGYALGHFSDCWHGPHRVDVKWVLRDCLGNQRPIVSQLPFGHVRPNCPLTLGAPATLDADQGTLVTPEGPEI